MWGRVKSSRTSASSSSSSSSVGDPSLMYTSIWETPQGDMREMVPFQSKHTTSSLFTGNSGLSKASRLSPRTSVSSFYLHYLSLCGKTRTSDNHWKPWARGKKSREKKSAGDRRDGDKRKINSVPADHLVGKRRGYTTANRVKKTWWFACEPERGWWRTTSSLSPCAQQDLVSLLRVRYGDSFHLAFFPLHTAATISPAASHQM